MLDAAVMDGGNLIVAFDIAPTLDRRMAFQIITHAHIRRAKKHKTCLISAGLHHLRITIKEKDRFVTT
jgi:hypothetical protein